MDVRSSTIVFAIGPSTSRQNTGDGWQKGDQILTKDVVLYIQSSKLHYMVLELIVPQKSKKLGGARGYLQFVKYQLPEDQAHPDFSYMAQRPPCREHCCQPRRTPPEILGFHRLAIYGISALA
ncbi:predicted protein [Histoplasma capsulatum var. duboisii H88]|uniref:Predicted protein n=1 Tax=Ajellomyces capsulatus (strain H88) TaxID=544711 RepID=F0ULR9_AJEC8|nr:predicted protein [Histoplasma capsulatum var. duboisii H88]